MFARRKVDMSRSELLEVRYDETMRQFKGLITQLSFFTTSDSPVDYQTQLDRVNEAKADFQKNAFFLLPCLRK